MPKYLVEQCEVVQPAVVEVATLQRAQLRRRHQHAGARQHATQLGARHVPVAVSVHRYTVQ